MAFLMIDAEQCRHEGACVAVCPAGIIARDGETAVPHLVAGGEALCIHCGHCVAVCPHGALSHAAMTPEQCPPLQPELLPSASQVDHLLRARRSIRAYRDKPLPRETLAELIETARHAPSGHNLQPVHWMVIFDTEQLRDLAGMVVEWMRSLIRENSPLAQAMHLDAVVAACDQGSDRICRGAPHLVVAHGPQENRAAPAACTIALAYLELAAFGRGLGTCWAGYFNAAANLWPPLQQALALPAKHASFGAMMVGQARFSYRRLPRRRKARISWR